MARLKHIAQRLENWALWRSRLDSNGLGYSSTNVLARAGTDVWGRNSYGGVSIPHQEQDAEEMDKAVQSLKDSGRHHLLDVLQSYYLKYLSVPDIVRATGKATSTVHANLASADQYIDAWLREQRRLKEEREALARGKDWVSKR